MQHLLPDQDSPPKCQTYPVSVTRDTSTRPTTRWQRRVHCHKQVRILYHHNVQAAALTVNKTPTHPRHTVPCAKAHTLRFVSVVTTAHCPCQPPPTLIRSPWTVTAELHADAQLQAESFEQFELIEDVLVAVLRRASRRITLLTPFLWIRIRVA